MSMFKKTVWAFVGILGLLILLAFALPARSHVERRISVRASAATAYALLSDMHQFNRWSPWFDLDPQAVYEFSGQAGQVGQRMHWAGKPEVGAGSQEIMALVPNQTLQIKLQFEGQSDATATLSLSESGGATEVLWSFDTELGFNPLMRWFGFLFFERFIGNDYEKGLAKLKTVLETPAAQQ